MASRQECEIKLHRTSKPNNSNNNTAHLSSYYKPNHSPKHRYLIMDSAAIEIPTPLPTEVRVKPVLKHPEAASSTKSNAAMLDNEGSGGAKTTGEEKKHLTWDEHAIEEHDLLRGTRMKIDEPNTPYTHYDHHSEDEASTSSGQHPRSPDENSKHLPPAIAWNALESKLQAVADKRDACPLSPAPSRDSNMSDSEGEEAVKRRKKKEMEHKKEFETHRKKHYNEAEAMKRWKMEHQNDDDEDDMEE
eukprot:g13075.t1 g13075   contig7:824696-825681(-)